MMVFSLCLWMITLNTFTLYFVDILSKIISIILLNVLLEEIKDYIFNLKLRMKVNTSLQFIKNQQDYIEHNQN
jgi:hypothetical protein